MWNVAQWFGDPLDATVTLDEDRATDALRAAARPPSRTRPPPPCLSPDPASPSRRRRRHGDRRGPGAGALHAPRCGQTDISITPEPFAVPAAADTTKAQAAADRSTPAPEHRLLRRRRAHGADRRGDGGELADGQRRRAGTSRSRPTREDPGVRRRPPALVNRAPVNGAVVTDPRAPCSRRRRPGRTDARSATPRRSRRSSPRSSATATAFTPAGTGHPRMMATSARMVEVNLSEQMLYMKENGRSSTRGRSRAASPSPPRPGHFTVQRTPTCRP
jgi:hypothetical protein